MSRNNSMSAPVQAPGIQVTEAEEALLKKIGTGPSDLSMIVEDPDHPLHKQDWTITTKPEESWANKEIRRKSVWSNIDENNPHFVKTTPTERRGSILSIWRAGKDKDGRDILMHDGERPEEAVAKETETSPEPESLSPKLSARERRLSDRRGSILSIWSNGKDSKGRDVMIHDDEEWKD